MHSIISLCKTWFISLILITVLSLVVKTSAAQATEVMDHAWLQRDRTQLQPIEYNYVREADVFWSKRIWRIIDTRQKINLPFSYPQRPLAQIIHEAAKRGLIRCFDPAVEHADQFKKQMDTAAIAKIGFRIDTSVQVNPLTGEEETVPIYNPLTFDKVIKYRVMEDWFFNEQTSTMEVRIIGLAPVMEDYDEQGNYRGDMTMYWVYFPDLRPLLAREPAFNPQNDWQQFSWDDLLHARKFASYIYKESNVYDRNIGEYATGADAQLEAERVKQAMFVYEHDLWEY